MITHEQAQAAKAIWNIADGHAPLLALIPQLPRAVLERLRAAHEMSLCCDATADGLWCCLDILMLNPADYTPDKVAAAKDLLERYWQEQRAGTVDLLARRAAKADG